MHVPVVPVPPALFPFVVWSRHPRVLIVRVIPVRAYVPPGFGRDALVLDRRQELIVFASSLLLDGKHLVWRQAYYGSDWVVGILLILLLLSIQDSKSLRR